MWHCPTSHRAELSRANPAGRRRHRWLPAPRCGDQGTAGTGRWDNEGPALHGPKGFSRAFFGAGGFTSCTLSNSQNRTKPTQRTPVVRRVCHRVSSRLPPGVPRGAGHLCRGPTAVPTPGLSPCAGSGLCRDTEQEASGKTLLARSGFIESIKTPADAGLVLVAAPGSCNRAVSVSPEQPAQPARVFQALEELPGCSGQNS